MAAQTFFGSGVGEEALSLCSPLHGLFLCECDGSFPLTFPECNFTVRSECSECWVIHRNDAANYR